MIISRKIGLLRYICRIRNNRLVKIATLGLVKGDKKRWRPPRFWLGDIKDIVYEGGMKISVKENTWKARDLRL